MAAFPFGFELPLQENGPNADFGVSLTLRQADRIYVMQAGRVAQEGTYAELVETEGVFRNLVRRQMA